MSEAFEQNSASMCRAICYFGFAAACKLPWFGDGEVRRRFRFTLAEPLAVSIISMTQSNSSMGSSIWSSLSAFYLPQRFGNRVKIRSVQDSMHDV